MDDRGINLVAALTTALSDAVQGAVVEVAGIAGAAPAALAVLLSEPGAGVDSLARSLGVTGSGAVRLVDRLTAAGLVERRAGRDARSVSVWLTTSGRRAARGVLERRRAVVAAAVEGLPPRHQQGLVAVAEALLAQLTRTRDEAERICRLCDVTVCPTGSCPVEQAVP